MIRSRPCGKLMWLNQDEEKHILGKCSVMLDVWHKPDSGFAFFTQAEGELHGCYLAPLASEVLQ